MNSPHLSPLVLIATIFGGSVMAQAPVDITTFSKPPAEFAGKLGSLRSPLLFNDGREVKTPEDWAKRREEIKTTWTNLMGAWPALIDHPKMERRETIQREGFTQHKVRLEVATDQANDGYLLVPAGKGPFPAVFVPYYEPETSIGQNDKHPLRDFAYQLTKRGFVSLSIGSPAGDARKPELGGGAHCQPLSYLGYVAANAFNALASMPEVDAKRIGIVGHSYGGKWAMFGSCLYEKYACGVWSDPGIVFDEARSNVNYWEPWYLGLDGKTKRKPGVVTPENPRTGAYKTMMEQGRDLHELHALMAPRPFLVSGGSEDFPARWTALNHSIAVNKLLGYSDRVSMTNRKDHSPTEESNAQIYAFFEYWLKEPAKHAK
jgi:dienelactone hydrolase